MMTDSCATAGRKTVLRQHSFSILVSPSRQETSIKSAHRHTLRCGHRKGGPYKQALRNGLSTYEQPAVKSSSASTSESHTLQKTMVDLFRLEVPLQPSSFSTFNSHKCISK